MALVYKHTPDSSGDGHTIDIEAGQSQVQSSRKSEPSDALETYLRTLSKEPSELSKSLGKNFADIFRSKYYHLKEDEATKLVEALLYYNTWGKLPKTAAHDTKASSELSDNAANDTNAGSKCTYSMFIQSFDEWMKEKHAGAYLKLCAIANEDGVSESHFGFTTHLKASLTSQIKKLLALPKYGIAFIIEQHWNLGKKQDLLALINKEAKCPKRVRHKDKPSGDTALSRHDTSVMSMAFFPLAEKLQLPSEECPTPIIDDIFESPAISLVFRWQSEPPRYNGSFDIFLWQSYTQPVQPEYVKIFYQDGTYSISSPQRVLVVVKSDKLLARLKHEMQIIWEKSSKTPGQCLEATALLLPTLAAYKMMVYDTLQYISQVSEELTILTYNGRKSPNKEKFQYLAHLEDSRSLARSNITRTLNTLRPLRFVDSVNCDRNLAPFFIVSTQPYKDLEYLDQELEKIGKTIKDCSTMIKTYRELNTDWRIGLLTILATIYAPLSYVCAVLSMQLNADSWDIFALGGKHKDYTKNSSNTTNNPTVKRGSAVINLIAREDSNLTIGDSELRTLLANQTDHLTDANAQYDAKTWMIVSSVVFIITLLLPLVGPDVLRYSVQYIYNRRLNWRIYVVMIAFIYYIMIYWAVPAILWHCYYGHWWFDLDGGWYLEDYPATQNFQNMVSFVISGVVLMLLGLTCWIMAVRDHSSPHQVWRIKKWSGFLAILVLSYMFDTFVSYDKTWDEDLDSGFAVSAIVPWGYLIIAQLVEYLRFSWR